MRVLVNIPDEMRGAMNCCQPEDAGETPDYEAASEDTAAADRGDIGAAEDLLETMQSAAEDLLETMRRAAEIALREEGVDPTRIEISLSFVSPEEIHALNRDYRGVDRVTDVLSFPLVEDLNELPELDDPCEPPAGVCAEDEDLMIPLGDVVICLEQAKSQALEYGHSERREIVYLFAHSMLHLLGYDHMEEEERRLMRSREEAIMQKLALPRKEDR